MDKPAIPDPGLCKTCRHARMVVSHRRSVFWMCQAHRYNPQMPRYPSLPVLSCVEYTPGGGEAEDAQD